MTLDLNNLFAKAALDSAYDTHLPSGSKVQIRTGAPAGAENAAGGTLLGEITQAGWDAAGGGSPATKDLTLPLSVAAIAAGNAGHFRHVNAAGTRLEEGTITATGGGGDAEIDNVVVAIGQTLQITLYRRTL